MQRRKFIKDTLTGFPLLFFTPTLLASCRKDDENISQNGKTVVVIGGGISGLAAAKKLKEKGFTVIVLEAQEKVGGRMRTDRSIGVAFDEGASWIHGPSGNPITNLASQSGANTFLTADDSVKVFDTNGTPYSESVLANSESQFNTALNAVRNAGTQTQSFQTVFNSLYPTQANDRLWKYMLSAFLEFNTGGDISKLSSKFFDDDEAFNGEDVIITNGYDKVTDFMAQGLDIRLNTRVTGINYSNTRVNITANGSNIEADYVVVSVPLGVLKNNAITFTPALPTHKINAITNTNIGNVNKFLLVWNTPFWDTNLQYIGYTPHTKGKFNYFLNIKKFTPSNGLMTFAFGDYATVTESMTDNQIINEIMLNLKSIYGNSIPNPINFLRTKWGQNINSFGAYAYPTNGSTSANFDTLANEINNKIFFAGEHTEREYRGTVHGAYLSGIREADKIINL
ncbi:MAG: FAD-dependent oxidoreductase [Sphingobacteriales bacterium]|nr:MAG: FAD-dependent oxidoreductase [Sphingobacteriales bacterium]TAF83559.1 MAG: FAD-dependent oxidoreductase [Sphingobacteriales bacterium]